MKLEPLKHSQVYHFYNRGNNKENVFLEEENYFYFLEIIKKHLSPIADLYSYCLLPNHFHLVFKIKDDKTFPANYLGKIHQPFSNFLNAYTKAFNKKYNRTGSLFQKHPKRIIIKNEEYLRAVIIYINTNPSHHNLANYENYKYSSYQSLISNKPTLLTRKEIINLFGDIDNFKYVHEIRKIKIDLIEELSLE